MTAARLSSEQLPGTPAPAGAWGSSSADRTESSTGVAEWGSSSAAAPSARSGTGPTKRSAGGSSTTTTVVENALSASAIAGARTLSAPLLSNALTPARVAHAPHSMASRTGSDMDALERVLIPQPRPPTDRLRYDPASDFDVDDPGASTPGGGSSGTGLPSAPSSRAIVGAEAMPPRPGLKSEQSFFVEAAAEGLVLDAPGTGHHFPQPPHGGHNLSLGERVALALHRNGTAGGNGNGGSHHWQPEGGSAGRRDGAAPRDVHTHSEEANEDDEDEEGEGGEEAGGPAAGPSRYHPPERSPRGGSSSAPSSAALPSTPAAGYARPSMRRAASDGSMGGLHRRTGRGGGGPAGAVGSTIDIDQHAADYAAGHWATYAPDAAGGGR